MIGILRIKILELLKIVNILSFWILRMQSLQSDDFNLEIRLRDKVLYKGFSKQIQ